MVSCMNIYINPIVFLLSVRKQLKTMFHYYYLQMKLEYLSGIYLLYIVFYKHLYIIQWEQISQNFQIYLLSLEETWIIIFKNMGTYLQLVVTREKFSIPNKTF